jgi:hypothetical protein
MEQINIEYLSQQLFIESVGKNEPLPLSRAEEICKPLVDLLEITDDECDRIAQYAVMKGQYCIDAQQMMKDMGIMTNGQRAAMTKRSLERFNIIPIDIQAIPIGTASNKEATIAAPPVGGGRSIQ